MTKKIEDVKKDLAKARKHGDHVVGTCAECYATEDRWSELLRESASFIDQNDGYVLNEHDVHKYKPDHFPKDISQVLFPELEHYPRNLVDVTLLKAVLENCPENQRIDYLMKAFRRYDAIYGKAHKQWLRYLMNECHEHALLDE